MNRNIKGAILIAAATFATFTVSAQTEELWLDKYETKQVIDTVAADSIEAAKNAAYNAERRDREYQRYAGRYLAEIKLIDQLIAAEESGRILEPISSENRTLYHKLKEFTNKEGVTRKDLNSILQKYKVPKGFSERVLQPAKAALQEKIDQFVPPAEVKKYDWRNGRLGDRETPMWDTPKKDIQIHKRVPNPECRDNYFNGNLPLDSYDSSSEYAKHRWDESQQSKGWEWVDGNKMESKDIFFPTKISYYEQAGHTEYRFKKYDYRYDAYDENGKLIRVDNMIGRNLNSTSMTKDVMLAICKRDFLANKYDINKSTKKTLDALRIRFGIVDGVDERFKQYKEMYIASRYEMVNALTPEEYGAALAKHDVALKVMKEYALKQIDQQADNYIKQLEADHENELKYLYKIERIDNTSFKLYYLNDKMECSCVALMKWFNTASYECEYEIELLPNETITIRR
ncbi:MAG: hypothetical protein SPK52_01780 [Synergistales bacterium]|nr:hypothetical protein [Bacteroidales bacterium]MDY6424492.1 hypothetical protein [Bacteroidales bacterium]MDY6434926.1 hypothetical protein [Synergistales bacterium]